MRHARHKLRVCFVTGTRAEFGLMGSVLRAIQASPRLQLQIVATGMHLDASRGRSIRQIERDGWHVDAAVPWPAGDLLGTATGNAIAGITPELERLRTDMVLVVGDRVEAFAGAVAGHLSGRIVAHVHGGDRALGQVDDSLRHAITKLSHLHFPATRQSAARIVRLGEDRWRVHRVGSPGIDGISREAASGKLMREACVAGLDLASRSFALVVLHPVDSDVDVEHRRAMMLLRATLRTPFERVVVVYPNSDPGAGGIVRAWRDHERRRDPRVIFRTNVARGVFLGLLRDAAVLVGNSSSGIIEAASFGTPVLDVGPRQLGRERSGNVVNVPYDERAIRRALDRIWNDGRPRRCRGRNVYGDARSSAGEQIARVLSTIRIDDRLRRKLIAF